MPKKILIVEDERLIGLLLAEEIGALGGEVAGVIASGRAAVQAARQEQPDAILMDISLSGDLDGIETARLIKASHDIPILFLTGYQDGHLLDRAWSVKPVGIVDKLDSTEAIRAAIASLLL